MSRLEMRADDARMLQASVGPEQWASVVGHRKAGAAGRWVFEAEGAEVVRALLGLALRYQKTHPARRGRISGCCDRADQA
jgi:hypothetical protein